MASMTNDLNSLMSTLTTTSTYAGAVTTSPNINAANSMLRSLINTQTMTPSLTVVPAADREKMTSALLWKFIIAGLTSVSFAQLIYDTQYINNALVSEQNRVGKMSNESRTSLYKMRQMILAEEYQQNFYRFLTTMLVFTLFVLMLSLSIVASVRGKLISETIGYILVTVILIFFIVAILMSWGAMSTHVRGDWSTLYFKPSQTLIDAQRNSTSSGGARASGA